MALTDLTRDDLRVLRQRSPAAGSELVIMETPDFPGFLLAVPRHIHVNISAGTEMTFILYLLPDPFPFSSSVAHLPGHL